jgi:hypothetical protein
MDSNERALLLSTLDQLVASADGADLTLAMDEFGWPDLLETEPELAISTVFSALGRFNHWSSALHDVMARRVDHSLWGLTDGATVLVPWPRSLTSGRISERLLIVKGLLLQPRSGTSLVVVVPMEEGSHRVLAVGTGDLLTERREGLDPSLDTVVVSGATDDFRVVADGIDATKWWDETVAMARVSICYSIVSLLAHMVGLATEHASSRQQFGRPIGTFQAVRHRLAESLVAREAAAAVTAEVWRSDDVELAAAVAKLVTSNSMKVVTAHVQQVLAGIGFTTEHEFHRYMKRAIVLDRLFENSTDLAVSIGRELVRLGSAPRLFEL